MSALVRMLIRIARWTLLMEGQQLLREVLRRTFHCDMGLEKDAQNQSRTWGSPKRTND
jgi:hypothetical protein